MGYNLANAEESIFSNLAKGEDEKETETQELNWEEETGEDEKDTEERADERRDGEREIKDEFFAHSDKI